MDRIAPKLLVKHVGMPDEVCQLQSTFQSFLKRY